MLQDGDDTCLMPQRFERLESLPLPPTSNASAGGNGGGSTGHLPSLMSGGGCAISAGDAIDVVITVSDATNHKLPHHYVIIVQVGGDGTVLHVSGLFQSAMPP